MTRWNNLKPRLLSDKEAKSEFSAEHILKDAQLYALSYELHENQAIKYALGLEGENLTYSTSQKPELYYADKETLLKLATYIQRMLGPNPTEIVSGT